MNFTRQTLFGAPGSDPAALCAQLIPGYWLIEAGHLPPPSHQPGRLPLPDRPCDGLALSLSSATLVGLSLGPALVDRVSALGARFGPLAGLALHELIVNAVFHGNLQVRSGRSGEWADLAERQAAIVESLGDRTRASRMVTIAVAWCATEVMVVIADEGEGYDTAAPQCPKRGSGRGLRLSRMVGRVDVLSGGSQTAITMDSPAPSNGKPA
jgi:hypothetical protein